MTITGHAPISLHHSHSKKHDFWAKGAGVSAQILFERQPFSASELETPCVGASLGHEPSGVQLGLYLYEETPWLDGQTASIVPSSKFDTHPPISLVCLSVTHCVLSKRRTPCH